MKINKDLEIRKEMNQQQAAGDKEEFVSEFC